MNSERLNPYEPPSQPNVPELNRAHCPNCLTKISWRQVAFGSFPVYLRCRHCDRRLIGTWMVKTQAVVLILAPILIVATMPLLVYYPGWMIGTRYTILAAVVIGSLLAILNVPATIYWGRYELRD